MGFHPTSTGCFYVSHKQPKLALISFWTQAELLMPLWTFRSLFHTKILQKRILKAPKLQWLTLALQGNYITNCYFWGVCDPRKADVLPNHSSSYGLTQVCLGGFATLITMAVFSSQMFTHPFHIMPFPSQAVVTRPLHSRFQQPSSYSQDIYMHLQWTVHLL